MSLNKFIYIHAIQSFFPYLGVEGRWFDVSHFLTRKEAREGIKRFEEVSLASFRIVSRRTKMRKL